MITVGLELTNFIDPSLTWKTLSKGRNTVKSARRLVSKSPELDQDQQLSRLQSSDSDKSGLSVQGREFGNMAHVPIKKRRFLFRSPSPPPPQSPKHCEESQQRSYANGNTEKVVTEIDISESVRKNSVTSKYIENTASSYNGVPFSNEDFSGISMLAAAACGGLDYTVGDAEKSCDLQKRDDNESFASAIILKENTAISRSTDSLEPATGQLVEEGCVVNLPVNSTERVCVERDDNESFASAINLKENSAISRSTGSHGETTRQPMEEGSVANLPVNSTEHVCLNSNIDNDSSQISEIVRAEANESVVSTISGKESVERGGSPDSQNKAVQCAEDKPADSPNKDIEIPCRTTDTSVPKKHRLHWDLNTIMDEWEQPIDDTFAGSCIQSAEVAQESLNVETSTARVQAIRSGDGFDGQTVACAVPVSNAVLDCGGFPGTDTAFNMSGSSLNVSSDKGNGSLHGTDSLALETTMHCVTESKTQLDVVPEADSGIDKIPKTLVNFKGQSSFRTGVRELDFSVKDVDSAFTYSKERKASDENDAKGTITCQSGLKNFLSGSNCRNVAVSASRSGNVSCSRENDIGSKNCRPQEHLKFVDANVNKSLEGASQLPISQSSCIEMQKAKLKDSDGIHSSSNMEALNTSKRDHQMDVHVPNVTGNFMSVSRTSKAADYLSSPTPENNGNSDLHISSEVSSGFISNNANVANARGYECHLEDGELTESVGRGWEENEGEEIETEHVDYDSDDREGMVFEAPNDDSVQLSGDVLVGGCEKQSGGLDKSVNVDFSLQHQNCSLAVDPKVTAESFKPDSPLLKPCLGAPLKGESRVERDSKGASANADSVRSRSRSSNYETMHQADCPGARRQPLVQTDLCCGSSQNVGLKSAVADAGPEEDRERVYQPRIISASRSGYNNNNNSMRRGTSGERDTFQGTRMVNSRDINLDGNSRNKFDRFSGGGFNRGYREGYHRPGTLNNFDEGQRSFSPRANRLDSHYSRSRQKSRSRSRTRSPDFRSEPRVGRPRVPYQPPSNHMRGGRSSSGRGGFNLRPRFNNNMGSPGRMRSNDGPPMRFHDGSNRDPDYEENNQYRRKPLFVRNDRRSRSRSRSFSPEYRPDTRVGSMRAPPYQSTGGPTRGRRSPARGFRQFQRYDNGGGESTTATTTTRFNNNNNNNNSQSSSRGTDYDNEGDNDFRRKPRNIFERIHPIRHHDEDGDNNRRFQYDDQDNPNPNNNNNRNFRRNENYGRGGGRRPVDFRRDDRGNNNNNNVRYDSDRMFDSGPKQFGGMRGS